MGVYLRSRLQDMQETRERRGVAQSGSARALGAWGRGFKSLHPDSYYSPSDGKYGPVVKWPKTPPFHGGNTGSIPVRVTKIRWCGGIGRHKGLKIPRGKTRTGSSPVSGTIERMSILRHSFLVF